MYIFNYRQIILSALFGLITILSDAQQNNILYFMKEIQQASFLNPAFSPAKDYVVGLPFISGVNIGFNNDFTLKNTTQEGHGFFSDTLKFNFNSFAEALSDNNKASFEADFSMFYLGIKDRKNFFSVSVNEKGFLRAGVDKRFVEFFENGIKPYYGKDSDLGGFSFHLTQYREFGFGFSRQETKKLALGARLKFLFGRLNLETGNFGFQIKSSSGNNLLLVRPSGTMDISGPVRFETDTIKKTASLRNDLQTSDYFSSFKNLGLAADLGFDYQASKQLGISASITDLGVLRFSKKNFIMEAKNPISYQKNELTQSSDPSAPDYFSSNSAFYAFRDSIPYMSVATETSSTQWVKLPVKLFAAVNYRLNKNLTFGFVEKLFILKDYFYSTTTFSTQTDLSTNFSVTGSWSIIKGSYFNLGVGAVYHSKTIQVYFVTDNIYAMIKPSDVKNLNLQLGINLLIGKG